MAERPTRRVRSTVSPSHRCHGVSGSVGRPADERYSGLGPAFFFFTFFFRPRGPLRAAGWVEWGCRPVPIPAPVYQTAGRISTILYCSLMQKIPYNGDSLLQS